MITARTLPSPALMNPFTVYTLCLHTLNTISDSSHSAEDKGILCRCMPERCLRACEIWHRETLLARNGKVVLMEYRGAVEACKKGLLEVWGVVGGEVRVGMV